MKETKFKQTEIGLIPEDWDIVKLENLYSITSSKRVFQSEWKSMGIPFYRAREIAVMSEGKKSPPDLFISEQMYKEYTNAYGKIHENDVLITGVGTLGKVYVVKNNDEFYFKDGNIIWLQWKNKNNSIFLKYLYDTEALKQHVFGTAGGSTVATYTITNAKKTLVQIPSKIEQDRIVTALFDIDTLIANITLLIEKKNDIKEGTLQNLLTGKKRLPPFAKTQDYVLSDIGLVPNDWNIKTLEDIFSFLPNNTFSRECLNNSAGEYQNIHYGDVLIKFPCILDCQKEEIPYINYGNKINYERYGIREGDIIIADTAEDETCGKVTEIYNLGDKKLVSGLHTILCRPKTDDFGPKWLGCFMNYSMYYNQLIPLMTGIKVSSVSKSSILSTKVAIPSKEEQIAITNILSDMDAEIVALQAKLEKYKKIKIGMMQQLLTGKIRLI